MKKGIRKNKFIFLEGGSNRYPKDIVPDINITSEEPEFQTNCLSNTPSKEQLSVNLEANDELSGSHLENDIDNLVRAAGNINPVMGKKKLRLRKMGSRQNSKTESDSSDNDLYGMLETPRRIKRKNFRLKQRSLDEDYSRRQQQADEGLRSSLGKDLMHGLKVKTAEIIEPIEHKKLVPAVDKQIKRTTLSDGWLNAANNANAEEMKNIPLNANENVFVKTKRKVFTTIEQPSALDGIAVVSEDLDVVQPKKNLEVNAAKQVKPATATNADKSQINRKCFSLGSLNQSMELYDDKKSHSADSFKSMRKLANKGIRAPLASDSFRKLHKSCAILPKDNLGLLKPKFKNNHNLSNSRTHLFKKNMDRQRLNGPAMKKIEIKLQKNNSSCSANSKPTCCVDIMDNTLPRISRKNDRKSLTPLINTAQTQFVFPSSSNSSEPCSPQAEQIQNRPNTPLSERALRLRQAKEEFLKGNPPRPKPSLRSETWKLNRRSNQSLGSELNVDLGSISKSPSTNTITDEERGENWSYNTTAACTPTQSEAGTDAEGGLYDSLPRNVSRSGKISSKLGFASLASKLRRAKTPKPKGRDSSGSTANSALTALCRQSMLTDIIAVPQVVLSERESVMKSQSTPHAILTARRESALMPTAAALNKSQSEQYVKPSQRQKESYV